MEINLIQHVIQLAPIRAMDNILLHIARGWAAGYTSAWNGDSGPQSSGDSSGQDRFPQNGNNGQGFSGGGGNLLDKAKNFCINNPNLCITIGLGLLSALG
jgi:hypothetical protein